MTELPATLDEAMRMLHDRQLSSVELIRACLDRINRLDDRFGAVVARFDRSALADAKAADADWAGGDVRPLLGIPIVVKDIIASFEARTRANSEVDNPEWTRPRDSAVVAALRRAGAVIIGKATTNEFALGAPDPTKDFPIPHNPWDVRRTPGGSSSGSAVAVVAGFCLGAIGSDTGGSIRLPSAFTGITGLLPTFGRVPIDGVVPLAASMDRVGPMARTALDCARMFAAMVGESAPAVVPELRGLRIGLVRDPLLTAGADPAAAEALDSAVQTLRALGAHVDERTLPRHEQTVAAAVLTLCAEAFDVHRALLAEQWDAYGHDARLALLRGGFVDASDYLSAQRVRAAARRELVEVFDEVDAIVMPTATIGAPERSGFDQEMLAHVHTFYWSALDNPVVAVPAGFTAEQLPVGLQFVGRPHQDAAVLGLARAFQTATDYHARMPELAVA